MHESNVHHKSLKIHDHLSPPDAKFDGSKSGWSQQLINCNASLSVGSKNAT